MKDIHSKIFGKKLFSFMVFVLMVVIFPAFVFAATAGPNSPGTMADVPLLSDVFWQNVDDAKVSNDTYVTLDPGSDGGPSESHYLKATDFGFSIPAGATVNGILVEIERRRNTRVIADNQIRIIKSDGSYSATNKSLGAMWSTTESYVSFGGAADSWGETWAYSDINHSNFGVVLTVTEGDEVNPGIAYIDHIRITVYYTEAAVPALAQSAYKWFANNNSTGVGRGVIMNQPMTAPAQGTPFRLRLLNHVGMASIAQSATTSLLQFAQKSGTCDTAFSGESYTSLSSTTGAIRYYNNSSATDGAALTANYEDPRHASSTTTGIGYDTVRNQVYSEGSNNFSNSQTAIAAGEDGLWDFSLMDYSAPPGTSYCFRAVQAGGGVYDGGYSVIPEITTALPNKILLRGNVKLRQVKFR